MELFDDIRHFFTANDALVLVTTMFASTYDGIDHVSRLEFGPDGNITCQQDIGPKVEISKDLFPDRLDSFLEISQECFQGVSCFVLVLLRQKAAWSTRL